MAGVQSALASMVRNIEEKTGKAFPDWLKLARSSGFSRHGEVVAWLKAKHGLSHGYANFIAKESLKENPGEATPASLVDAQYAGAKARLRPLYQKLIDTVEELGSDLEIAPKKANVSIRRTRQFAIFQPTTQTRIDVGLILKGVKPAGRLEASGSFNAMFTHRVRVESEQDIDAELKRWLKQAYANA